MLCRKMSSFWKCQQGRLRGPQHFFSGGNSSLGQPQKLNVNPTQAWNNFIHYCGAWILSKLHIIHHNLILATSQWKHWILSNYPCQSWTLSFYPEKVLRVNLQSWLETVLGPFWEALFSIVGQRCCNTTLLDPKSWKSNSKPNSRNCWWA